MKHLPKYLQPRWRYLAVLVETWPNADFDRDDFQRHCWYAAQNLLGDAGSADVDLTVLRFALDEGAGHAIVRARRDETRRARAALACVDTIAGHEVGLRVAGVSGTVRACEEKYIRGAAVPRHKRTVAFEDAERTAIVRNGRADVWLGSAFAGATTLDFE